MEDLSKIYNNQTVPYQELFYSPSLLRLDQVGMNCGLEYTSFPLFVGIQPYSRYQHSIGVSHIIYHFTHDQKQALSGLFHDIATPTFAHVIDFLNHDYLTQESTEEKTGVIIQEDEIISQYLNQHSISNQEVENYHIYSIADNDSPKLSADRLEYTLGNSVNYGFASIATIKEIYDDLIVGINEYQEEEIMFQHLDQARKFGELSLQCSHVYVADYDRYAMEYLARLIKKAIEFNVLNKEDLYLTEPVVIQKMTGHPIIKKEWVHFCKLNTMITSPTYFEGAYCIDAKKRMIDPYVFQLGRLSNIDVTYKSQIEEFKHISFDYYILGMVK